MIRHSCMPGKYCRLCEHAGTKKPCGCGTCDDCPPVVTVTAPDLPRWHPVPPVTHAPTRDRLVITVATGDTGRDLHALTGPSQRAYAERIGAEYAVLTDATQDDRMPCAEKWRYGEWVRLYPGGSVCIDADVFVRPTAPDLLDLVPPDAVGLRDITDQPGILAWAVPEYRALCRSQGVPPHPRAEARYWNSGVWVGRPEHADYWASPPSPFPATHCAEEHWCRHALAVGDWPVFDLGEANNWLWYQDRACERAGGAHFLHLAGMSQDIAAWGQGNKVWRLALLRLLAATQVAQ